MKLYLQQEEYKELIDNIEAILSSNNLLSAKNKSIKAINPRHDMAYDSSSDTIFINIQERLREQFIRSFIHEIAHINWFNDFSNMEERPVKYTWILIDIWETLEENNHINNQLEYLNFFNEWLTEIYAQEIFNIIKNKSSLEISDKDYFSKRYHKWVYNLSIQLINDLIKARHWGITLENIETKNTLISFYKSWNIQWFLDFISGWSYDTHIISLFKKINDLISKSK